MRFSVLHSRWALGRTTSVSRPNGVQSIYGYADRGLLGSLRHVRGASEVASFSYTFDASGLRTGAGETFGGVANPVTWTHDLNMRLTDETRAGATQSWGYDAVSNRTSQTAGGSSITTVFDMRDRLTSLGQASFVWDASGRLRARTEGTSITRYTWTDNDRLTRVELPTGGVVSYGYDAQGLMVSRTSATGTTHFVWDGTLPYGQVVATTSASGALDSRWVYGTDRLAEIHADTVLWLLTDGLGNVRAVTDSVGGVVGQADFDAWGNRTVDSGRTSAFGYRGEWVDPSTGMVYLRARWMDPNTGRFVSEDPYEGDPNGPVSLHRFLYANQSPVMMSDPTGRMTLVEAAATVTMIGLLASFANVSVPRLINASAVDIEWNGFAAVASLSLPPTAKFGYIPSPTAFALIVDLTSKQKVNRGDERRRLNVITMVPLFGFSIGAPFSETWGDATMYSAGAIGISPLAFVGGASWISLTGSVGPGKTLTSFSLGSAFGEIGLSDVHGLDLSLDAAGGASIPVSWMWVY